MSSIDTVHVVFKTHLDIGFTDFAKNVVDKYIHSYIPRAIDLAEQLDAEGGSEGFIWTTGSWLIHEYLRRANREETVRMKAAIAKGYIAWHGLPFTTHTELLDAELFEYGLSLAQALDKRFGRTTIAAKMTDVPGHTKASVSHMAKFGIQYLHLGVNPASKVPSVPKLFVWKGEDGTDIIVNYADNYGNVLERDELQDVLVFAHTGDNSGPPSIEDIRYEWARLSKQFPGATIKASTMDAFAEKILDIKSKLPVVREEIGDSWIHGAATDPKKVAMYRALTDLRHRWLGDGRFDLESHEYVAFSDNLLLVAEHTWGMDEKKFLKDYTNYSVRDFTEARKKNEVPKDAVPEKYKYLGDIPMNGSDNTINSTITSTDAQNSFQLFESSWNEQRDYISNAVQALSEDKQVEVKEAFAGLEPSNAPGEGQPIKPDTNYAFGRFTVQFSSNGSIQALVDQNGKVWADDHHQMGLIEYESFGVENYHTWFEQYVENIHQTHSWADADFGKPGMENTRPRPDHERYRPKLASLLVITNEVSDRVYTRLNMPCKAAQNLGAPEEVLIVYEFDRRRPEIHVTLNWFRKQANRLPEATWFSFTPNLDNPNLWKMDKMGELISPLEVVRNGNRNLHAVHTGVYYDGADGSFCIKTLDAAVVSPGDKRLLQFDNSFAPLEGGMHFVLHNNIWGTNFPMWYEEDAKFRFSLTLESTQH